MDNSLNGQQLATIAGAVILGLLVLYVAVKIASFLIRVALVIAVLAALAGLVWWVMSVHH
jgi:hypothetical protein